MDNTGPQTPAANRKRRANPLMRRRSFGSDIVLTTLTNILVLISAVLTYGLAARIFQDDALFSAYGTLRRVNLALRPVLAIGMAMALTRYLPLYAPWGRAGRRRLTWQSTLYTLAVLAGVSFFMLALPEFCAQVLLGDQAFQNLIPGLVALNAGIILHTHGSSYFRGRLLVDAANLMQIVNVAVIPLVVLLVINKPDLPLILIVTGSAITLGTLAFLPPMLADINSPDKGDGDPNMPDAKSSKRDLLSYGLHRVPGFIAMSLLFVLGPILVAHLENLAAAVYVVIGMQILSIAATPVKPLATVFLPRVSEMVAQGKEGDIGRLVSLLSSMLVQLGAFMAIQMAIFLPALLSIWLNREASDAMNAAVIIALCVPAYLLFESLRSVVDSYTEKPYVAWILVLSLVVLVVVAYVLKYAGIGADMAVAVGCCAAFYALGGLTMVVAHKLMIKPGTAIKAQYLAGLAAAVVLGGGAILLSKAVSGVGNFLLVAAILLYELLAVAALFFLQLAVGAGWAVEVKRYLAQKLGKN